MAKPVFNNRLTKSALFNHEVRLGKSCEVRVCPASRKA
jgi:hypothetical protein